MVVFGILSVARSKSGSPDREAVARSRKAQYSRSLSNQITLSLCLRLFLVFCRLREARKILQVWLH